MTNDVVKHLATIDVFEEKVEMALSDDNVPHCADIRVSEKRDNCSLTDSADLAILVFGTCPISTP